MKRTIPLRRYLSIQFAAIAVLPVAIIAALAWLFIFPQMRANISLRDQTLARTIAGQVSAHLKGGENQLTALADYMTAKGPFPPNQLTALLDANCGQGDLFESIYTTTNDQRHISNVGLAYARRPERSDLMGMDLSGRDFLFHTQPDMQVVWSQTFLSTVSSSMAVALTVPMLDGLIIGEITLTKLSAFISHLPVEERLFALVVDRQGRIVADSKRIREGQQIKLGALSPFQTDEGTRLNTFQIDGLTVVGGGATIKALNWLVLVAQPYASALRPLRKAFVLIVVGLVLAMIIALALAWHRAGNLSRLFHFYNQQAQAISRGEYELRLPPSRTTEFKVLGENLQIMAQTIYQREAQLVASEKQIKGIIANVPGVVYQFRATRDHVYTNEFISENAVEIFGLAADSHTIFKEFYYHIPDDEKDHYVRSIKEAVDEVKPWVYEGRFIKPSGETIWFASNAIPYEAKDAIDFYGVLLDITSRKKMESSLRLTQFCFEKASIGIFRIADDGQILDVNEQACRNLDYTREELCHLKVFDIDPDYTPQRYADLIAMSRNMHAHMIETRHQRRNGETFPIQIRLNLTRYEDQEFMVAFIEDISERKQWQRKLEESERRYRSLFDEAPMMYVVTEKRQNGLYISDANNSFLDRLGYRHRDVIGTQLLDYYTEVSKVEGGKDCYQRTLNGETQTVERSLLTRKGDTVHTIMRSIPEFDREDTVIGSRAMYLDTTDLRRAEEAVRKLRNYLSNIIDSMPSVLVGVDSEGNVTQWNRQAEKLTGLTFENVQFRPLADVFPRLADQMKRIRISIRDQRVLSDLKVPRQQEGGIHYEDVTIYPLVADGVEGAVIRVDDVTERVRMEEMMIQSEKMLSVGGLAAGMAHEINNPLAGILQNAAVLKNRLMGDLPANRTAAEAAGTTMAAIQTYMQRRNLPVMIENIRTSGKRAATIVKNMLSFARKSDRVVSIHDLGTLLDQTLELARTDYDMKTHYDFKQIRIVREYDAEIYPVPCEASKLQQVFLNILKNGAEAMAECADKNIPSTFILRVKDEEKWIRVEIEDNGPGVAEATRRRIFEPFFTTKPVGQGTGLGLSVSYFIITENHGGEMDAYGVDGGGTRFVIRLPKSGKVEA